jgi:hypothetical protein
MIMVMVMGVFMRVFVIVVMSGLVSGIGAAHRVKGPGDFFHGGAKSGEHGFDDVVAQDQNLVGLDCRGQMAIADMPGELGEMGVIAGRDFVERFVGGGDGHHGAIVKHELIS